MINTEHYRYFVEIAYCQSITRAATQLFLSQPYLSSVMSNLEKAVGLNLLKRNRYGVTLTSAGKRFLEIAEKICKLDDEVNQLKYTIKESELGKRLSISSIYSFTMLELFHRFASRHIDNDWQLLYKEMPNRYIPDEVIQCNCDLGVVYLLSPGVDEKREYFKDQGLCFTELITEPLHLVVGASHPLANESQVDMNDLIAYPLIVETIKNRSFASVAEENIMFPELFSKFTRMPVLFDNNRSLMYYLTRSNNCISIGQKYLNLESPFYQSGALKYIPIADAKAYTCMGTITLTKMTEQDHVVAFIDTLKAYTNSLYKRQ